MHQGDFAAEAREEVGLFHGGIAAADHHDLLAAIEEAVAGGASADAVADQLLLAFEAQPARAGAAGDDQGAGLDPLAFDVEAEGTLREIGVDDGAMHELGAEILRLQLHVLDQVGTVDALGEAREVLHQSGQRELSAGFVAGDHERLQIGAGGVDGGRVAGAAGTYDHYVSHWSDSQVSTGVRKRTGQRAGAFSYHFRRVESMQAMSGRPSLLRSTTAQAAAPMPPLSEVAACPVLGGGVVAVEVDAARLAAEAGDDFVHAIAVEVGDLDGVAVDQGGVDDFALPLRAVLGVDRDLVAVPGLDGGQKSRLVCESCPTAISLEPDLGHGAGSPLAISVRVQRCVFRVTGRGGCR